MIVKPLQGCPSVLVKISLGLRRKEKREKPKTRVYTLRRGTKFQVRGARGAGGGRRREKIGGSLGKHVHPQESLH